MKWDIALSSFFPVFRFALALIELGDLLCELSIPTVIRSKLQLNGFLSHIVISLLSFALFMEESGDQIDPPPSIRTAHTTL